MAKNPQPLAPGPLAEHCRTFRDFLQALASVDKMPEGTDDLVRLLTATAESPQVAEMLCERLTAGMAPVQETPPVAGMWAGRK